MNVHFWASCLSDWLNVRVPDLYLYDVDLVFFVVENLLTSVREENLGHLIL